MALVLSLPPFLPPPSRFSLEMALERTGPMANDATWAAQCNHTPKTPPVSLTDSAEGGKERLAREEGERGCRPGLKSKGETSLR